MASRRAQQLSALIILVFAVCFATPASAEPPEYISFFIIVGTAGECGTDQEVSGPYRGPSWGPDSSANQARAACEKAGDKKNCRVESFRVVDSKTGAVNSSVAVIKKDSTCYDGTPKRTHGIGVGPNPGMAKEAAQVRLAQRDWNWKRKDGFDEVATHVVAGSPTPVCANAEQRKELASKALPYAELSRHIYKCPPEAADLCPMGGWRRAASWVDLVPGKNGQARGFNAAVFVKEGQAVLVFEGTKPTSLDDWLTNIPNWLGKKTPQYELAGEVGIAAKKKFKSLVITGHSLGGGLAQIASQTTGLDAITFNAASPYTGSAEAAGTVTNIVTDGEFISEARKAGREGELVGTTCTFKAKCAQQQLESRTVTSCPGWIAAHSMDAVIDSLSLAHAMK